MSAAFHISVVDGAARSNGILSDVVSHRTLPERGAIRSRYGSSRHVSSGRGTRGVNLAPSASGGTWSGHFANWLNQASTTPGDARPGPRIGSLASGGAT